MDKKGIEQIKEMLMGVEVLVKAAKAVLADGKVDLADLPVAMGLIADADKLVKAVEGITEIPAEVGDLEMDEIRAIVQHILDLVAHVKA